MHTYLSYQAALDRPKPPPRREGKREWDRPGVPWRVLHEAKPSGRAGGTLAKTTLLPDGDGLYLQLSTSGRTADATVSKSWVFRSAVGGRETRVGLGPYPEMSLIEARKLADGHRATSRNGTNPLEAKRQKERDAERAARERQAADALAAARGTTFKEAAEMYIAGQEAGWSSTAYRAQWRQSLKDYVYPVFGDLPVADPRAGPAGAGAAMGEEDQDDEGSAWPDRQGAQLCCR